MAPDRPRRRPPPAPRPRDLAHRRRTGRSACERRRADLGPSLSTSYRSKLSIVRGTGPWLVDHTGRHHLDCVNNVCHVGHAHPHVVAALTRQAAVLNTNTRYLHPTILDYAERLAATFPDPLQRRLLRELRLGGQRARAAHGAHRHRPPRRGRRRLGLPRQHQRPRRDQRLQVQPPRRCRPRRRTCNWPSCPTRTAGASGRPTTPPVPTTPPRSPTRSSAPSSTTLAVRPPSSPSRSPAAAARWCSPSGYLREAYRHARAAGALCIADEVQVGFGRVGSSMWAFELQGVVPDIVTLGKPMGNGHPLAAVVTTPEIAAAFANGMEFFSTFGGNPVSCAVGMAVLDVIEREELMARAAATGSMLLDGFRELQQRHELIGDVRGVGHVPRRRPRHRPRHPGTGDRCRRRGGRAAAGTGRADLHRRSRRQRR